MAFEMTSALESLPSTQGLPPGGLPLTPPVNLRLTPLRCSPERVNPRARPSYPLPARPRPWRPLLSGPSARSTRLAPARGESYP